MFEPTCEFPVKTGASFLSNNLSVFHHKAKGQTFAAYLGKEAIQLLAWNDKLEQTSCELLAQHDITKGSSGPGGGEKPVSLMQVHICLPAGRNNPIFVVLASTFVSIWDFTTRKRIFNEPTADILLSTGGTKKTLKATPFTRGICCVDNLILAGCNSGEIVVIVCTGDAGFQMRKNLKEHTAPVTDIASCMFDLITVSGDVAGNVLVWSKNMKSVNKRISTNQPLTVLNILRKQVFCGNLLGQISVYSVLSGALLAEINAHSRQITSLAVAIESAYIMSASEDTYVRIWKLHSRNPEAYKIEFRYAQRFENMPIMGACFSNTRGSGYLVSFYENFKLLHFKISRRLLNPENAATATGANPTGGQQAAGDIAAALIG